MSLQIADTAPKLTWQTIPSLSGRVESLMSLQTADTAPKLTWTRIPSFE